MTKDDTKTVLDALVAAHVYVLHLPGRMYQPEEGEDCSKYYCFACHAPSGKNHRDDCEVIELERKLFAARNIATVEWNKANGAS